MFRRLVTGLPQDPCFPADLASLGFYINEKNQIRRVDRPNNAYQFRVTNDDRTNETYHEAFYVAIRKEVRSRLRKIGIGRVYLPQLTGKKPQAPHIPIIATPAKVLRTKKRLVVVVNDEFQDLGLLSYRTIESEAGVEDGSILALTRELIGTSELGGSKAEETSDGSAQNGDNSATPGILVLNPGESLYSYSRNEAMSRRSWRTLYVASAAHPPILVDAKNYVAGNKTPDEHVAFVFDKVIGNPRFVHPDAEIYVIGLQARGDIVLGYLNQNWNQWAHRIKAVALTQPRHSSSAITNSGLRKFLSERGRAWSISNAPIGTPLAVPIDTVSGQLSSREAVLNDALRAAIDEQDRDIPGVHHDVDWCAAFPPSHDESTIDELSATLARQSVGTSPRAARYLDQQDANPGEIEVATVTQPIYSAGEVDFGESILPVVYKSVVRWFEDVARAPDSYKNPPIPLTALWRDEEASSTEDLDVNEFTAGEGGEEGTQLGSVVQEREYASGEADAIAEHGGFVVKENEEQPEERVQGPA